jgi:hypothetical protein
VLKAFALIGAFAGWGVVGALSSSLPSFSFLLGLMVGGGIMLIGKEK